MARHNKTLPARRQTPTNDSLLIRSAESLGRAIGSLQRQLDAARRLTGRATSTESIANSHRPVRQRVFATKAKAQRKTKSARKSKRAARPAAKKTSTRRRSATKRRTS
jgi:hypothetical protein